GAIPVPPTQKPVHGDHGEKAQSHRAEVAEAGKVVLTVGIDQRQSTRKFGASLMMVDDHDIEIMPTRRLDGLEAGGAAVDGDEQRMAGLSKAAHRLRVRPVSFEDAIGNIDR